MSMATNVVLLVVVLVLLLVVIIVFLSLRLCRFSTDRNPWRPPGVGPDRRTMEVALSL